MCGPTLSTRRFYFCVSNVQPGVPYKFNIVNFRKKQSLFSSGKQPLVCLARLPSSAASSRQAAAAAVNGGAGSRPSTSAAAASRSPGELGGGGAVGESALVSSRAANSWVRAGSYVTYYPSPFRGRRIPPVAVAAELQARRPTSKKVRPARWAPWLC